MNIKLFHKKCFYLFLHNSFQNAILFILIEWSMSPTVGGCAKFVSQKRNKFVFHFVEHIKLINLLCNKGKQLQYIMQSTTYSFMYIPNEFRNTYARIHLIWFTVQKVECVNNSVFLLGHLFVSGYAGHTWRMINKLCNARNRNCKRSHKCVNNSF